MFDSYTIKSGPSHPSYVSVTEHRAPTDESVRLLKEMQEKATQGIIEAVQIKSNAFECVIHFDSNPLSIAPRLTAIYSLNGKKMHTYINLEYRDIEYRVWIEKLLKAVSEDIASQILHDAFKETLVKHRNIFMRRG